MDMWSFLNGTVSGFYDLLEHERLQISSFLQVKKILKILLKVQILITITMYTNFSGCNL
jgi:hypothetical protein